MRMYPKPEHRDFVPRQAVQVYDAEGILMVVPQDDGETPMETAEKRVALYGMTVIFADSEQRVMVVAR